jgi:hypothetical protein
MRRKLAQAPVTVDQLVATTRYGPGNFDLFRRYAKQKPTTDAIPVLRVALGDPYHGTVKCAAHSLKKLGPLAREAMGDLLDAASRVDPTTNMPQAYPECLAAMVAIEPNHPDLLSVIKNFTGLDNWVPISASLRALSTIDTAEAHQLQDRIAAFWMPELDKAQRRVVEQLLLSRKVKLTRSRSDSSGSGGQRHR